MLYNNPDVTAARHEHVAAAWRGVYGLLHLFDVAHE